MLVTRKMLANMLVKYINRDIDLTSLSIVRLGICMYRLLSYPNAFIGYPEARPS